MRRKCSLDVLQKARLPWKLMTWWLNINDQTKCGTGTWDFHLSLASLHLEEHLIYARSLTAWGIETANWKPFVVLHVIHLDDFSNIYILLNCMNNQLAAGEWAKFCWVKTPEWRVEMWDATWRCNAEDLTSGKS